ncbi:MAG: hypothetical protein HPZ91_06965 [Lentisphaeria bacterium]|nr:hypothetical protein [Lentisphaeria bacterium]
MKRLMIATVAGMLALSAWSAGDLSDLRGLVLTHAKLPVYNKQNLQMMVFCSRAERSGRAMVGYDAVLDLIRRGADVDSIRNGWNLKAYPLDAKLPEILAFWTERPYSDGVILTSRANVDQETRMADGDEPVFFRSPLLDLNGIGFEADFDRRSVLVKEDVNIVLRMEPSDPRRILAPGGKQPEKYEFVTATSDSMRIDMANNQILLVGNVVVDEENSVVTCDRMTIFLDRRDDAELRAANDRGGVGSGSDMGGVSRVLCDGNVVVTRKLSKEEIAKGGEQKAFADHLVYDPVAGTVVLTGDRRRPVVKRGGESLSGETMTLHREEQRAVISRNCEVVVFQPAEKPGEKGTYVTIGSDDVQLDYLRNCGDFIGNVVVDDPRMQLKCARMRIDLKELAQEKAQLSKEAAATLSGMPDFDAGSRRELDRITCTGGVDVMRRDAAGRLLPDERGTSRNAVFDYMTRTITMTGDAPTLKRGNDSLSGGELLIWVNDERVSARNGSRVVLGARTEAPGQAGRKGETVILSDSSDLNYGGNLLTFNDDVKVDDDRMKLDCDKMEIFLLEQASAGGEKKGSGGALALDDLGNGDRSLSKVLCTGRVHAVDPGSDMRSDRLTLHFAPQAPGVKTPGMFQSDGTELVLIEADGALEIVNTPAPGEDQKAAESDLGGLMKGGSGTPRKISSDRGQVDFRKNITEFHGSVHVRDAGNSLKCDDMYLFAGKAPAAPEKGAPAPAPDLDDDPFALASAGKVPARISLTENLDLRRVLCQNNVLFVRRTAGGEVQRAGGHQADYVVADRVMVMTGEPGKQPWMSAEGRRMYADRIIVDVVTETMRAEGNTSAVTENEIKI